MPIAVVTGANAGLGYQTALQLAQAGFDVVMACRNAEKAKKAHADLLAAAPGAKATVIPLDVSEPVSIRGFVREFSDRFGSLDLVVNNAGIAVMPLARNSVGHEMQLATNHLGAFALTGLLFPLMRNGGRIVNLGSLAHRMGKLELDDLNWERTPYDEWKGYARSKVAILNFTMELDRRLRESGSKVIALAAHPGFAATEISKQSPRLTPKNALSRWINRQMELHVIPSAAKACASTIYAATSPDAKRATYYGPTGLFEMGGKVGVAKLNPAARDSSLAAQLWTQSESMTGVRYLSA